ncbi:SHOCT domain-containing protein [Cohnella hashimotonis]|uniref:SHOCT domain-containing protein n=1 Tax=Cohnella hashimotonis TaxID=2826895 RepID=A0ABT6TRX9_9BACL|nr:SHOCT domain-containing protein [Cohnella hashimotonis]MDI4649535.1 SHOCT domain-containing protein [Cohnella hashimotonis]
MMNPKKHKKLAVTSLALAVAVFGSAVSIGSAFAATTKTNGAAAQTQAATSATSTTPSKGEGQHRGGGFRADWNNADVAALLNLTEDQLKTQLTAGKTLSDIAAAQGVDAQKVQDLIVSAMTKRLDSRLADGKITQTQYDEQKATLAARAADALTNTFSGKGGGKGGHGGHGGGRGGFGGIDLKDNADIASLLGLTTDELSTQLESGKSLSDLAADKGVAVDTVTAKVVSLLTTALDQRLADGKITQTEYDAQKAKLADHAAQVVSRTFTGHDGAHGKGGKARTDADASDSAADTSASASSATEG